VVDGRGDDAEDSEKQRQRDADLPAEEQPVGQCGASGGPASGSIRGSEGVESSLDTAAIDMLISLKGRG
jgi:hypothetical protein